MHKCLNNKKTARLAPFTILADLARWQTYIDNWWNKLHNLTTDSKGSQ
jgi:hypothetical protein